MEIRKWFYIIMEIMEKGNKIMKWNRRKAIKEQCLDCAGFSHSQVRKCTFENCPLYPFRTGKGKQNAVERDRAIKKYCLECMNGNKKEVSLCPSTDCHLYFYRNKGNRKNIAYGDTYRNKKNIMTIDTDNELFISKKGICIQL